MRVKKTREDVMRDFFPHFAFRLSERYGILITFDEYKELCDERLAQRQFIKVPNGLNYYKGILTIHGIKVRVYKSATEHCQLTTCVFIKFKFDPRLCSKN